MAVKYKRVLLKVSGEALAGAKGSGFDEAAMREAENMLYTEFALVLDIQPKDVVPFIRRELGGEA